MVGLWDAVGSTDPASVLLNTGIVGAVAVLFLTAVVALFRVNNRNGDRERQYLVAELDNEHRRSDRMDDEIRELEKAYRERYVPMMGEASRSVADALELVRELRSELERIRRGRD